MKGKPAVLRVVETIITAIIIIVMFWFVVAGVVFRLRHPWATETEIFVNMDKALGFRKVSQNEIRD